MQKLGFIAVAIAALAISGCGGSTSTPAPPPAPTPTPMPGQVQVAFTTAFGVNGAAANANTIAFQAPTQTAAVTVTQANYTGGFTAVSNCAQVTVAPAAAANGAFTVTAADAAAAGCTVTFTGAANFGTGTLAATVPKPAGVVLRWFTPNYTQQQPPVPQAAGPINLVGTGALFATQLQISEQNYISGFAANKVTASGGCTGFATATAEAAVPAGLPAAAPGSSVAYYTVTGVATILTTGGCTITAADSYVPLSGPANPAVSLGVEITTVSGVFQ